jgi:hypothetical protein
MRHLSILAVCLTMALTTLVACGGSKKPVASPNNTGDAATGSANDENAEENINTPTDPDEKSADPCEGGE